MQINWIKLAKHEDETHLNNLLRIQCSGPLECWSFNLAKSIGYKSHGFSLTLSNHKDTTWKINSDVKENSKHWRQYGEL